ncbi:hypothetical protein GW17_00032278, partial [Ensete ventricosum]
VGNYLHWRAAFWVESILMLPFAILGFIIKPLQLKGSSFVLVSTMTSNIFVLFQMKIIPKVSCKLLMRMYLQKHRIDSPRMFLSLSNIAASATSPPLFLVASDEKKECGLLLVLGDEDKRRQRPRKKPSRRLAFPTRLGSSREGRAESGCVKVLPLSLSSSFSLVASSSLATARLISLSSAQRQSKSTITDLFWAVIGPKQPCII